jgi:hypothetical protein
MNGFSVVNEFWALGLHRRMRAVVSAALACVIGALIATGVV